MENRYVNIYRAYWRIQYRTLFLDWGAYAKISRFHILDTTWLIGNRKTRLGSSKQGTWVQGFKEALQVQGWLDAVRNDTHPTCTSLRGSTSLNFAPWAPHLSHPNPSPDVCKNVCMSTEPVYQWGNAIIAHVLTDLFMPREDHFSKQFLHLPQR